MDMDKNTDKKSDFKPYVPPEQAPPELTVTSVVIGVILAVVFGAANAYLGLRVGMTVSASIPAAVVSMGVLRILLRRKSVLESNIVQTIGSAGESLAAGAIFTMPVFFLWAKEGCSASFLWFRSEKRSSSRNMAYCRILRERLARRCCLQGRRGAPLRALSLPEWGLRRWLNSSWMV